MNQGKKQFKINYESYEFTLDLHSYSLEQDIKPEKVQHYSNFQSLIEFKNGNRAEYRITFLRPTLEQINILNKMNCKLVDFTPHIDAPFYNYKCWMWFFYDDSVAYKDKVYIELVSLNLLADFPKQFINRTPKRLDFGDVYLEQESKILSFNLDCEYIIGNITITAPEDYWISKTLIDEFTDILEYTYEDNEIDQNGNINATVYVKFIPTVETDQGSKIEKFIECKTDVDSLYTYRKVIVIGNGIKSKIVTNLTNLNFGLVEIGMTSPSKTFTIQGVNLTNDLLITCLAPYQISKSIWAGFTNSILLTIQESVAPIPIYVRVSPLQEISYNYNIECTSTGADTVNILCNSRGTTIPQPYIITSGYYFAFNSVIKGNSSTLTFVLEGFNLLSNLTLLSSSNEVLLSDDNITFSQSLTVDGVLKTIYIKFEPLNTIEYEGTITINSINMSEALLYFSGVCVLPNILNKDSLSFLGIVQYENIHENDTIGFATGINLIPMPDNNSISFMGVRNYQTIQNKDSISFQGYYHFEDIDSIGFAGQYDFNKNSIAFTGNYYYDKDSKSFVGEEQSKALSQLLTLNL